MRLDHATWPEVEEYLRANAGIILPVGSTEQHGPMGLIGTDSLCAQTISRRVGKASRAYVAPFNTGFAGTISICEQLFEDLIGQVFQSLWAQGFRCIYVMNGHGANIAPMRRATQSLDDGAVLLRNWWDFEVVTALRREFYGDWEGMHATPSEVAITQATVRMVPPRHCRPATGKAVARLCRRPFWRPARRTGRAPGEVCRRTGRLAFGAGKSGAWARAVESGRWRGRGRVSGVRETAS